jgi:hypothetical protein
MKSIHEMTADTEAYRQQIRRLVETDLKAEQIYIEMRAELAAARQLRENDAWRLRWFAGILAKGPEEEV